MKKILLASAGVMVMSAGMAYAACIPTPSCSSLGYESSSSCAGGIKCPFGNAWNCTLTDIKNKVTEIENKITTIEKENALRNCVIGSIFYSDKTCSMSLDGTKTPIGVVVYSDGTGHGQVMSLKSIGTYEWGRSDIPTLTNFNSREDASYDLNSCSNTEKIIAFADKKQHPAAWAAHEYKTEGTNAGDWCLPAAGVFTSYYNNQQVVNTSMVKVGGTQIKEYSGNWSSSEQDYEYAWSSEFSRDYGLDGSIYGSTYYATKKEKSFEVRPVIEF